MTEVSYDKMTARAQRAFGCYSGDKVFVNLPSATQNALIALEVFLESFGRLVRV